MRASFVADLLDAPDAQLILNQVQQELNEEKKRRHDFYEWLTDDIKAEFINGQVIMHSPVKRKHLVASKLLVNLLLNYANKYDFGEVDTEKAMVSLTRNDYEPDICFWRKEVANTLDDEMMQHPAPDLVIEILSKSTAKRDRGIKFEDYAAHGVREYWLIDPTRQTIEQYGLDTDFMAFDALGNFHLDDTIEARTVTGFRVPVRAVFEREANNAAMTALLSR